MQLEIIKYYYPVLLEYIPCYTSEIYVFAKTGTSIAERLKIDTEECYFGNPIPAKEEFIPLKECNLTEICPSRFTKILLTLDFLCNDSTDTDYLLVLETSYKGTVADWRAAKTNGFFIKNGEVFRIFLPFCYELLVKDSRRIANYDVKIYLWNKDMTEKIEPLKYSISTFKGNPYMYGRIENLR